MDKCHSCVSQAVVFGREHIGEDYCAYQKSMDQYRSKVVNNRDGRGFVADGGFTFHLKKIPLFYGAASGYTKGDILVLWMQHPRQNKSGQLEIACVDVSKKSSWKVVFETAKYSLNDRRIPCNAAIFQLVKHGNGYFLYHRVFDEERPLAILRKKLVFASGSHRPALLFIDPETGVR